MFAHVCAVYASLRIVRASMDLSWPLHDFTCLPAPRHALHCAAGICVERLQPDVQHASQEGPSASRQKARGGSWHFLARCFPSLSCDCFFDMRRRNKPNAWQLGLLMSDTQDESESSPAIICYNMHSDHSVLVAGVALVWVSASWIPGHTPDWKGCCFCLFGVHSAFLHVDMLNLC